MGDDGGRFGGDESDGAIGYQSPPTARSDGQHVPGWSKSVSMLQCMVEIN